MGREEQHDEPEWPDLSVDISSARRTAESVRVRQQKSSDSSLVGSLSNELDQLRHRLAAMENEQRSVASTLELDELRSTLRAEIADERRAGLQADESSRQLIASVDEVDQRTVVLERALLAARNDTTTLMGYLEASFEEIRRLEAIVDGKAKDIREQLELESTSSSQRIEELDRVHAALSERAGLQSERLDRHDEVANSHRDQLEHQLMLLKEQEVQFAQEKQIAESLASEHRSQMSELSETHSLSFEELAARQSADYLELRDRAEEARGLAEKAGDKVDFTSDSLAKHQADLDKELERLNAELHEAASQAELDDVRSVAAAAMTAQDLDESHRDLAGRVDAGLAERATLDEVAAIRERLQETQARLDESRPSNIDLRNEYRSAAKRDMRAHTDDLEDLRRELATHRRDLEDRKAEQANPDARQRRWKQWLEPEISAQPLRALPAGEPVSREDDEGAAKA